MHTLATDLSQLTKRSNELYRYTTLYSYEKCM